MGNYKIIQTTPTFVITPEMVIELSLQGVELLLYAQIKNLYAPPQNIFRKENLETFHELIGCEKLEVYYALQNLAANMLVEVSVYGFKPMR